VGQKMSDYDAAFEAALKGPASSPYDDVMKAVMDKVKPAASAPESVPLAAPPSFLEGMKQTALAGVNNLLNLKKDMGGGLIRGAGSGGATLMQPFESAQDNKDRRAGIDANMKALGANPDSFGYGMGKLGGELMLTGGVGGLLAKTAGALGAAPVVVNALSSGGMTTGVPALTTGAKVGDMALRTAAGALTGGATAGMVNLNDAGTGALIGGATPGVMKIGGAIGGAIGNAFSGGGPINPTKLQTAKDAVAAGYQIPPNMLRPSLKNQVIESISGKQATQQLASTHNTEVTDGLVRQALGIAPDVPITQSTLEGLRKTAGKAYAEVSSLSPQAAADLEALKVARNESQGWYKAYNRSARPDDLAKAKEARDIAASLESALETHAQSAGKPELIPALRNARKEIAKTYTVGRAMNDASGTIDARVLGRMHEKGLPLSDGLDVAGKFASAFPTVAKSPMQIGSPAAHNLKSMASAVMGGGGYAAMGPAGVAAAALPFIAPPIARSVMFSNSAQQAMLKDPRIGGLLDGLAEESLPLLYRSGGLLAGPINAR
jgi:hypothetical protein